MKPYVAPLVRQVTHPFELALCRRVLPAPPELSTQPIMPALVPARQTPGEHPFSNKFFRMIAMMSPSLGHAAYEAYLSGGDSAMMSVLLGFKQPKTALEKAKSLARYFNDFALRIETFSRSPELAGHLRENEELVHGLSDCVDEYLAGPPIVELCRFVVGMVLLSKGFTQPTFDECCHEVRRYIRESFLDTEPNVSDEQIAQMVRAFANENSNAGVPWDRVGKWRIASEIAVALGINKGTDPEAIRKSYQRGNPGTKLVTG